MLNHCSLCITKHCSPTLYPSFFWCSRNPPHTIHFAPFFTIFCTVSGQTLPSDQSKQSSEKTVSRPTSAASRANTAKSLKSPVKDGSAKKTKKKPPLTVAVNKDVQHRRKPGKRAAIEVRHLQQTTHRLISCAGFAQVVKSIVFNGETKGAERNTVRYQRGALALLQEASEAYLTGMFQV